MSNRFAFALFVIGVYHWLLGVVRPSGIICAQISEGDFQIRVADALYQVLGWQIFESRFAKETHNFAMAFSDGLCFIPCLCSRWPKSIAINFCDSESMRKVG